MILQTPMAGLSETAFDIALSFADERRQEARFLAEELKQSGFKVFFDEHFSETLAGSELESSLGLVFREQCRNCAVLVSPRYKEREWPLYEASILGDRHRTQQKHFLIPINCGDHLDLDAVPKLGHLQWDEEVPQNVVDQVSKRLLDELRLAAGQRDGFLAKIKEMELPPAFSEELELALESFEQAGYEERLIGDLICTRATSVAQTLETDLNGKAELTRQLASYLEWVGYQVSLGLEIHRYPTSSPPLRQYLRRACQLILEPEHQAALLADSELSRAQMGLALGYIREYGRAL